MNPKLLTSLGAIVLLLSGCLLVSVARQPKVSVDFQKTSPTTQASQTSPTPDNNGTVQTQVNIVNDKTETHVIVKKK